MYKNTVLAAAITATLSTMNLAYASLKNCNDACAAAALTNATLPTAVTARVGVGPSADGGKVYGTHLFGSAGNSVELPTGTGTYAAVTYEVKGTMTGSIRVEAVLDNAKFAGEPELVVDNGSMPTGSDFSKDTNGDGKSNVVWNLNFGEALINNGEKFHLFYKIDNAGILAQAGEKIQLTLKLGRITNHTVLGTGAVTIASSKEPVTVETSSGTDSGIKVSVASGNTEFSSRDPNSTEFYGPNEAVVGYFCLENIADVYDFTGKTWALGNTNTSSGGSDAFDAGYDADNNVDTALSILGGQFAASVTDSKGAVTLKLSNASTTSTYADILAESVTTSDAIFQLSNDELMNIAGACSTDGAKIPITVKTDGTTPINLDLENPPELCFKLDYAEANSEHDIDYPESGCVTLRKFRQDGTSCMVYQVPPSSAIEELNLRITNDSNIAGTVKGTLYALAGGDPVFTGVDLLGRELKAGETVRITNSNLENDLEGGPYSWTGRGTMQITSTLPRLEIMTLLRNRLEPGSPLINMSVGAHGTACAE